MGTNDDQYAVVMGDIVGSERFAEYAFLHERFNRAVERENERSARSIRSPLTITLGDEFQGLATSLSAALSIVRSVRMHLMADGIDCRFVVAAVELSTPLNPDRAWNMMGPGLAGARARLNEKQATSLYRFSIPAHPLLETALDALGAGLTAIERRWTKRQQEDIAALIEGATPAELAHFRNVSVHSVYKVRNAGHFDAYLAQWSAVQTVLSHVDAQRRTG